MLVGVSCHCCCSFPNSQLSPTPPLLALISALFRAELSSVGLIKSLRIKWQLYNLRRPWNFDPDEFVEVCLLCGDVVYCEGTNKTINKQ